MALIAGRVMVFPRGDYIAGTDYDILDMVFYNGLAYISKQESVNIEPANADYWMPILANKIPTKLSELENDTGFVTSGAVASAESVVELSNQLHDKVDKTDMVQYATVTNVDGALALKADRTEIPLLTFSPQASEILLENEIEFIYEESGV